MKNNRENMGLSINLGFDKAQYKGKEGQNLRFTLVNESKNAVTVLKWNTPLEGFNNDIFNVETDGKKAVYLGRIVKRGLPQPEDYITLDANESTSVEFDITEEYDISEAGNYKVEFKPPLLDVGREEPEIAAKNVAIEREIAPTSVPSNIVQFKLLEDREPRQLDGISLEWAKELKTIEAKGPTFSNCSQDKQNTLKSALAEAVKMASNSKISLSSTLYNGRLVSNRFITWFGNYNSGVSQYIQRYEKVMENYQIIRDALADKDIRFNCDCNNNYYAYVYPTKPYEIWLCNLFWSAPLTGTDSKAGTIIHEVSHFNVVAGTQDHVYGQSGCQQLAISDPSKAMGNADCHEYFAENNPLLNMGTNTAKYVALRASNNQYVVAEGGGGDVVNANRTARGPWETFALIDMHGGSLMSGDPIHLQCWNCKNYLVAENGGGREVMANRGYPREWETFIIQKINGSGVINHGDKISLRAYNGNYVVAEGGGGGVVNANRAAIGPWETFKIEFI